MSRESNHNDASPWGVLGIAPTSEEAAIKRAYASKLKKHRPDQDKAGFLRLRDAYEEALRMRHWVYIPENDDDDSDDNSEYIGIPKSPIGTPDNLTDTLEHTPEDPDTLGNALESALENPVDTPKSVLENALESSADILDTLNPAEEGQYTNQHTACEEVREHFGDHRADNHKVDNYKADGYKTDSHKTDEQTQLAQVDTQNAQPTKAEPELEPEAETNQDQGFQFFTASDCDSEWRNASSDTALHEVLLAQFAKVGMQPLDNQSDYECWLFEFFASLDHSNLHRSYALASRHFGWDEKLNQWQSEWPWTQLEEVASRYALYGIEDNPEVYLSQQYPWLVPWLNIRFFSVRFVKLALEQLPAFRFVYIKQSFDELKLKLDAHKSTQKVWRHLKVAQRFFGLLSVNGRPSYMAGCIIGGYALLLFYTALSRSNIHIPTPVHDGLTMVLLLLGAALLWRLQVWLYKPKQTHVLENFHYSVSAVSLLLMPLYWFEDFPRLLVHVFSAIAVWSGYLTMFSHVQDNSVKMHVDFALLFTLTVAASYAMQFAKQEVLIFTPILWLFYMLVVLTMPHTQNRLVSWVFMAAHFVVYLLSYVVVLALVGGSIVFLLEQGLVLSTVVFLLVMAWFIYCHVQLEKTITD